MDDVVYKRPGEDMRYSYPFDDRLPGDTAISAEVAAVDSTGADSPEVIGTITTSGTSMTVVLTGGVDGEDYVVAMTATGTTTSEVRDWLVEMRVRDQVRGAF